MAKPFDKQAMVMEIYSKGFYFKWYLGHLTQFLLLKHDLKIAGPAGSIDLSFGRRNSGE